MAPLVRYDIILFQADLLSSNTQYLKIFFTNQKLPLKIFCSGSCPRLSFLKTFQIWNNIHIDFFVGN